MIGNPPTLAGATKIEKNTEYTYCTDLQSHKNVLQLLKLYLKVNGHSTLMDMHIYIPSMNTTEEAKAKYLIVFL